MPKERGRRRRRREGKGAVTPPPKRLPGTRRQAEKREPQKPATVSPLAFWRRARPRSFREQPPPKRTVGRLWRRFSGFYFPPWVPVAVVIAVVGAILLSVIVIRESGAVSPTTRDHWHAAYEIYICGQRQPPVPFWQGGVHTHGDGFIHIHPQLSFEEGTGARLVKWFEYGGQGLGTGGKLSKDTLQIPGQDQIYRNGDPCSDGQPGVVQVYVNGQRMRDFDRYIPQDGDVVQILFGPEGELPPGVVFSPTPVPGIRTITIEAGDRGQPELDAFFDPSALALMAGERVRLEVKNTGSQSHNLRIAGVDGQYNTDDDFVSGPQIITPGQTGSLEVQIDEPGTYAFRCDIHPQVQVGTLTVEAAP